MGEGAFRLLGDGRIIGRNGREQRIHGLLVIGFVQNAGRAGLLTGIKGLENAGLDPKDDTNNWQPRVGFAYDVRGDGKDVIRGGWGIYMDMAYTNSNALFAASDATGNGFGTVFNVDNQAGIRNQEPPRRQPPQDSITYDPSVHPEAVAAWRNPRGSQVEIDLGQAASLRNPVPRTPENTDRSRELYRVNCSMCHGPEGKGNGYVAAQFRAHNSPSIPVDFSQQSPPIRPMPFSMR